MSWPMRWVACALIAAIAEPGVSVARESAQAGGPARRAEARVGALTRLAAGAMVLGTAWRADTSPIPYAPVRLRRLPSGLIAGRTGADASGEFTFGPVEPGTYIVELIDERERVLAASQIFTLEAGETVAVFVRLAARGPWLGDLLSNTAASVISSAASLGITAVAPPPQAASPVR